MPRRGLVDHTYYTQIDVVRTIEQILGLPPMNQRDLVATPMTTAFTNSADLTPFTAVPNQVPLDEMNPAQSASRLRQAWIQESAKLFTSRPRRPDEGDENLTKRAIWYSSFDFKTTFPWRFASPFPLGSAAELPLSFYVDNLHHRTTIGPSLLLGHGRSLFRLGRLPASATERR